MKPSLVLPLATALAGFALGWLAKPAATDALTVPPLAAPPSAKATAKPAAAADSQPASLPPATPIPVRDPAVGLPGATAAERSETITAGKNAAKLLRLAEVLGLSDTQVADLKKLIAETRSATVAGHPAPDAGANAILDHYGASGAALEKSLAALFTPEQTAMFEDLRKRERDNRIEATAQRELGTLTEVTDLSAEQRDQVLAALRKATTTELGSMPASLALMLDSSALPLAPVAPSAQSIQTLRLLAESQTPADPATLHAKLIERQRQQLDDRLNLVKDILTPAQLAQYRATIAEQHAIHDMMSPPPR